VWRGVPFYVGPRCMECAGTGFHGRTAIHELPGLTDHIQVLILERGDPPGGARRESTVPA
jgi:type IV pilus assembly protein PilB